MYLAAWIFLLKILQVKSDTYASVQEISNMLLIEHKLVHALSNYLVKTQEKLDTIKRYLKDYEDSISETDLSNYHAIKKREPINFVTSSNGHRTVPQYSQPKHQNSITETQKSAAIEKKSRNSNLVRAVESLAGNPIHAYHLIRRISTMWKHLQSLNPCTQWKEIEKLNHEKTFGSMVYDESDLQGAAKAILRLKNVYRLNITDLIRGNLMGMETQAELRGEDCLYLGKHSFNMGEYDQAIEWFQHSHSLAASKQSLLSQQHVLLFLDKTLDTLQKKLESTEKTKINRNTTSKIENVVRTSVDIDIQNYQKLCRGEQIMSESYKSTLKCFYDARNSTYLIIMPAKVEIKHHDPLIIIFHDVISDRQLGMMKEKAKSQLLRSTVVGKFGENERRTTDTRISKVFYIDKGYEQEKFQNLNFYMSAVMGLSLEKNAGEPLQIVNYGVGGHYFPHWDFLLADKTQLEINEWHSDVWKNYGDRIATFLIYLSDVPLGGDTVFPRLGVSITPTMRSAAFWYNLKKSGECERLTLHGACPVLLGSKWISTKWVRERKQFQKRQCSLNVND